MDINRDIGTEKMRVEEVERAKRKEKMLKDRVRVLEKNIEKREKEEREKHITIRGIYKEKGNLK